MTLRRAAGLTALGSVIAVVALMVLLLVQVARAPTPTGTVGVIALTESPLDGGIVLPDQHLAVLQQIGLRRDLRNVRSMTYEAIEGLPVLVVILRRPLSYGEAIDLDAWVRGGGDALIFAEPDASWAAPGDTVDPNLRDATWGRRLTKGGLPRGAGQWTMSGGCRLRLDGLLAECRPGKGRALLVADTGLLDRNPLDPMGAQLARSTGLIDALVEALQNGTPVPATFAPGGGALGPGQPSMLLMIALGSLVWVALGALIVWVILINMANKRSRVASGPARVVRDHPARIVNTSGTSGAATPVNPDPEPKSG